VVGAVELAQTSIDSLHLAGPIAARIRGLDFALLGYAIVAVFAFAWAAACLGRRFSFGRRAPAAARAAR
jgi:high-affinity nickel permease